MQGRFSRIFELFNQRNTEYYRQAFDRLEKENKTTFNFAAAFFVGVWLVFRKMYGWALLLTLANGGIQEILQMLSSNPTKRVVGSCVFLLILFIGFGFFGNSLYYKHIKSKVTKGYAEIANYNSIDPIGGIVIVGIVMPILVGIFGGILVSAKVFSSHVIGLLSVPIQIVFIAIIWAIDHKKFHSQESVEPVEVTDESVNIYLEKDNPKHLTISMGIGVISYLLSFLLILSMVGVLAVVGMKATGKKISNQLDKIGEEVSKMPNKKAKKGIKTLDDKETRKQLDEIDKINKRIIEKQKLGKTSKTDESMRKDLDALHDAWAKLAKDVKK
ncbi:MAG: DUF2628 domain-containing protein [Alphaproteobacteria bacterium]|nr:DUF2628 domain-containing protein [Alphaproteobacteria bacterium]